MKLISVTLVSVFFFALSNAPGNAARVEALEENSYHLRSIKGASTETTGSLTDLGIGKGGKSDGKGKKGHHGHPKVSVETLVTVPGLDLDAEDPTGPGCGTTCVDEINNAYVDAFNTIHPEEGYEMENMQVTKEVDAPEDDEEAAKATVLGLDVDGKRRRKYSGYFWAAISYSCGLFCPDDDRVQSYDSFLMLPQSDPALHKEFEETFCARLRMTKLPELVNVHDCTVVYLHKMNKEAPENAFSAAT